MDTNAFYQTVAGLCFTLLGLWWAVVQFRHDEWMSEVRLRRMAYSVHLSFLVPGIMSVGAMTMGDIKLIWRLVFITAAAFGIVAMLYLIAGGAPAAGMRGGWRIQLGRLLTVALYALIGGVAVVPSVSTVFGAGLQPLQVEGLLLTLLIFLGASIAWSLLAAPRQQAQSGADK